MEKYQPVDEEAAWKEFMAQFPADTKALPQRKPAHSAQIAPLRLHPRHRRTG